MFKVLCKQISQIRTRSHQVVPSASRASTKLVTIYWIEQPPQPISFSLKRGFHPELAGYPQHHTGSFCLLFISFFSVTPFHPTNLNSLISLASLLTEAHRSCPEIRLFCPLNRNLTTFASSTDGIHGNTYVLCHRTNFSRLWISKPVIVITGPLLPMVFTHFCRIRNIYATIIKPEMKIVHWSLWHFAKSSLP